MNLKRVIDGAVKASFNAIKKSDIDYVGENGLLYCGKCNTPKQTRVEVFGEVKTPMCLCKCESERKEKEEREERLRNL